MSFPVRPRRLRNSSLIRDLVHEIDLSLSHLIQPYFLASEPTAREAITGFTDVFRWGVDALSKQLESDLDRGLKSFLLFGSTVDALKIDTASQALDEKSLIPLAVKTLKARFGERILLMTDVCLCPYTSHGHCGVVKDGYVSNDPSLEILSKMALLHAESGADVVAPSDMMDGRVRAIRNLLDEKGFERTAILAYTAKYHSSYYGPFREALSSSPKEGDRASYQMDFRNANEAIRELRLDLEEGADLVMVKPALAYLDIIAELARRADVPVVAYSVSGEYEMVKRLAAAGMADERRLAIENLTAIRRAGARIVITYFASTLAEKGWLE